MAIARGGRLGRWPRRDVHYTLGRAGRTVAPGLQMLSRRASKLELITPPLTIHGSCDELLFLRMRIHAVTNTRSRI